MSVILTWVMNNKLLSLSLIALVFVSVVLGFTRIALSYKTAEVKKQKAEIVELKAVQKENEATITALKQFNEQQAAQKKKLEEVNSYLRNLPPKVIEAIKDADIQKVNHCLFAYFVNGVLPEGCDKADAAALSEATRKAK